jgi:AraC family transcriptional regulator, ethanolamine operon transcriptional activator
MCLMRAVLVMDVQSLSRLPVGAIPSLACVTIDASDACELAKQTGKWRTEFTQLSRGDFRADGIALALDGLDVARIQFHQSLLHRGCVPANSIGVLLAGRGSSRAFVRGEPVTPEHCVRLGANELFEAITHGPYSAITVTLDLPVGREWLESSPVRLAPITAHLTIAPPASAIARDMVARVERLLEIARESPRSLQNPVVRSTLTDHVLVAVSRLEAARTAAASTARREFGFRRAAVSRARDLIHSRLSEPLRVTELCQHGGIKIRALEYGFREVTGLTPLAYIRALRLNFVRRVLMTCSGTEQQSISQLAMDAGFMHLSQFAADYRAFFGELPTDTRKRAAQKNFVIGVQGRLRGSRSERVSARSCAPCA